MKFIPSLEGKVMKVEEELDGKTKGNNGSGRGKREHSRDMYVWHNDRLIIDNLCVITNI